jgi:hypothetical protein
MRFPHAAQSRALYRMVKLSGAGHASSWSYPPDADFAEILGRSAASAGVRPKPGNSAISCTGTHKIKLRIYSPLIWGRQQGITNQRACSQMTNQAAAMRDKRANRSFVVKGVTGGNEIRLSCP